MPGFIIQMWVSAFLKNSLPVNKSGNPSLSCRLLKQLKPNRKPI